MLAKSWIWLDEGRGRVFVNLTFFECKECKS